MCTGCRKASSSSVGGKESRWKQRGSCLTLPTPGRAYRLQPADADVIPAPAVRATSTRPSSTVERPSPTPQQPPALLPRPPADRSAATPASAPLTADMLDDVDRFFLMVTDVWPWNSLDSSNWLDNSAVYPGIARFLGVTNQPPTVEHLPFIRLRSTALAYLGICSLLKFCTFVKRQHLRIS